MVRQLHVLGVTDDGDALLLGPAPAKPGTSSGKPSHQVRLDDRLRAAVRGQLARPGADQHRAEMVLTPKEIQSRLRAGETPEEVAKAAGVPVTRLTPYAAPVEAERQRIVDDARAAHLHRSRGPAGSRPLGETVDAHLGTVAGLKTETVDWSARRRRDGAWVVSLTYSARGGRRAASWLWRPLERDLTALDVAATRLAADETGPVRRSASAGSTAPARKKSSARPAKKSAKKSAKKAAAKATKAAATKSATRRAPSKAASASKAATARKAAAATKAATTRKAAARKAAAAGKAATTRTAAAARKAATTKPTTRTATKPATKTATKATVKPAATKTAKPAKATKVAKVATTTKAAVPVRKAATPKAPVRKAPVRKAPARKPAARKTPTPTVTSPSQPFRPTLVETPPSLTPVTPIHEPVAQPVAEPAIAPVAAPAAELAPPAAEAARPAAEARAVDTRPNVVVVPSPAAPTTPKPTPTPAPARKAGQRVPVPSWSDVLLGVQPHRDDADAPKG